MISLRNNTHYSDIKPENLIFDSPEEKSNLRVIDFGTSRRIRKGEKLQLQYGTVKLVCLAKYLMS